MKPRIPKTVALQAIGYVRNKAPKDEVGKNRKNIVSEIVLDKRLTRALLGIESYSHIYVIYFMHEVLKKERRELRRRPGHGNELAKVGVFAIRGRVRPNPMGLTVVELLGRKRNVLKVRGLDAFNGSPVLDIKPYDHMDVIPEIKVPDWWFVAHPSHAPKKK